MVAALSFGNFSQWIARRLLFRPPHHEPVMPLAHRPSTIVPRPSSHTWHTTGTSPTRRERRDGPRGPRSAPRHRPRPQNVARLPPSCFAGRLDSEFLIQVTRTLGLSALDCFRESASPTYLFFEPLTKQSAGQPLHSSAPPARYCLEQRLCVWPEGPLTSNESPSVPSVSTPP